MFRPSHPRHYTASLRALRSAFTLAEMAVVLLIVSILTAAAVPTFLDSLIFHRIESAARRVKADLELARQTARLTSSTQTLTFAGASYSLGASVAALDQPLSAYTVNLAAAPYEISGVAVDFGGDNEVSFNGFGAPSSGGTVVLTAPKHQCTVSLNSNTGEVSISRAHNGGRSPE